jgi:hypothetical protein
MIDAAGDARRAGGERVFVDCDVRQIGVDLDGSLIPAARAVLRAAIGQRMATTLQGQSVQGLRNFLVKANFRAGIKGTT